MGTRYWSLAGTAILEIDAIVLTVKPPGECRVWIKHFGQTYVRKRCTAAGQLKEVETAIGGRSTAYEIAD